MKIKCAAECNPIGNFGLLQRCISNIGRQAEAHAEALGVGLVRPLFLSIQYRVLYYENEGVSCRPRPVQLRAVLGFLQLYIVDWDLGR